MNGGDNRERTGPVADSRRGCCTYEPDRKTDDGWWTLCPAHVEADAVWREAAVPAAVAAVEAGRVNAVRAALAVVGSRRVMELPTDADRVHRFLDALELLS